ncbi:hypothetical protein LXL81_06190 [Dyadobacter sp. CY356]|nr:hypothetical protein [Dyadobacter sp. CY356]
MLCYFAVYSQDSTKIKFSEEQDTIVQQRFIDRYENVFMTKVPTRHMFKLSLNFIPNYLFAVDNNALQTTSYGLGYEYKISPSFSVGTDILLNGGWGTSIGFVGALDGNIYGRWYYDMRRRIKEGINVNNFTGNYVAIVGGKRWGKSEVNYQASTIGIEFGLQRRFLNNGRIEFAIGASYQKYPKEHYPLQLGYGVHKAADFAIASRTSMGLAFGDWKRNKNIALCEVLLCDENVSQQWKLLWPKMYLSSQFIQGTIGLAYERKFGNSPISFNGQVMFDYLRMVSHGSAPFPRIVSNDIQLWPSLQLRYYLDQKQALRDGKGGQNLSGLYLGPHSEFVYYQSETVLGEGRPKRHLGLGAAAGFQQRLFRKAYVDLSVSVSHNLLNTQPEVKRLLASVKAGFGITL